MAARWFFEKPVHYMGETIQRIRRCTSLISVVFTAANKRLSKTCFTDIALSVRIYSKYANEIPLFFSIASICLILNYRFGITLLWRWINKYEYYFTYACVAIDIKVMPSSTSNLHYFFIT